MITNPANMIGGDERKIRIDEVNMPKGFISGTDTFGRSIQVVYTGFDPVVSIPQQGEIWIVKRYVNQWRLTTRFETGTEGKGVPTLAPGDKRLEASNDLYLNGNDINITARGGDVTINLADGYSLIVNDANGNPLLKVTEDGTYHMRQGSSWAVDL